MVPASAPRPMAALTRRFWIRRVAQPHPWLEHGALLQRDRHLHGAAVIQAQPPLAVLVALDGAPARSGQVLRRRSVGHFVLEARLAGALVDDGTHDVAD